VVRNIHGGQQAFTEGGLFPSTRVAVPRARGFQRLTGPSILPVRPQHATEMHPDQRRKPDIAGGLRLPQGEFQRGDTGRVVPGLTLGAT
jgi:hypothetical protein